MKSTGIVRSIDGLGRVVIPAELRNVLGIDKQDPLEIFTDDNKIVIQKYQPNTEKEYVIASLKKMAASTKNPNVIDVIDRAIKLIR